MFDEEREEPQEEQQEQAPAEPEEGGEVEEPAAPEEPAPEEPAAEEPAPEEPAAEEPAAEEEPAPPEPEPEKPAGKRKKDEAIPGAHLEPDLVLEEEREAAEYQYEAAPETAEAPAEPTEGAPEVEPAEQPAPRSPLELAADARYQATGKRKSSVARVVLKPGSGEYRVNGRSLDEYFPRPALQKMVRQPLETAGYESRMDVVARIHGGGVASQAGALRHGVTRALVEADPSLRIELKRRGYLTRDARAKERKKAGLKKARKRPQFSKR
jgi:small subunit ribosomal protein S9